MTSHSVLKELRLSRNLTLRELGLRASMDHIVLNKMELGLRMLPPLEGIIALADAMNLNKDEFEMLLDEAARGRERTGARFTSDEVRRIKESRAAEVFFTRRVEDREE